MTETLHPEIEAIIRQRAREAGRRGGKARAAKLTEQERKDACRKAARVRWERYRSRKEAARPGGDVAGAGGGPGLARRVKKGKVSPC